MQCNFGVWGKTLCGIAVVGAGSFGGAEGGSDVGVDE